jgi:hypothetical protein
MKDSGELDAIGASWPMEARDERRRRSCTDPAAFVRPGFIHMIQINQIAFCMNYDVIRAIDRGLVFKAVQ